MDSNSQSKVNFQKIGYTFKYKLIIPEQKMQIGFILIENRPNKFLRKKKRERRIIIKKEPFENNNVSVKKNRITIINVLIKQGNQQSKSSAAS